MGTGEKNEELSREYTYSNLNKIFRLKIWKKLSFNVLLWIILFWITNNFLVLNLIEYFLILNCTPSDIMQKMEQCMPTLETILGEVDQFVESDKTYNEAPHIIDVVLPLLCSYLPFWWAQGPDNVTPTGG